MEYVFLKYKYVNAISLGTSIGIYDVSSDLLWGAYYVPFQSIRATLTLQMQNGTARTLLRLYIIIMMCTGLLFCSGRSDLAAHYQPYLIYDVFVCISLLIDKFWVERLQCLTALARGKVNVDTCGLHHVTLHQ